VSANDLHIIGAQQIGDAAGEHFVRGVAVDFVALLVDEAQERLVGILVAALFILDEGHHRRVVHERLESKLARPGGLLRHLPLGNVLDGPLVIEDAPRFVARGPSARQQPHGAAILMPELDLEIENFRAFPYHRGHAHGGIVIELEIRYIRRHQLLPARIAQERNQCRVRVEDSAIERDCEKPNGHVFEEIAIAKL